MQVAASCSIRTPVKANISSVQPRTIATSNETCPRAASCQTPSPTGNAATASSTAHPRGRKVPAAGTFAATSTGELIVCNNNHPTRPEPPMCETEEQIQSLIEAINDGDYEIVCEWVNSKRPVVDISHPKRSILILAAQTGFLSILRALLAAYDWHSYQRALDLALISAMKIGHGKCINLLMDNGANPDAVDWWLVYQSYDADILSRFLTEKKNLDSFICELGGIGKPLIGALKRVIPNRPDMEKMLVQKVLHCQTTVYFGCDLDSYSWSRDNEKDVQRARRNIALLLWAGVNPRLKVETRYDGCRSILQQAICYGDSATIKKISVHSDDLPDITQAAGHCYTCNETTLKMLSECGFTINDREDGTSSVIANLLGTQRYDAIVFFGEHGAKLPEVDVSSLKKMRNMLSYDIRRNPGEITPRVLSAFHKILNKSQRDFFNKSSYIRI